MKVSVIIPVWNGEKYIEEAVCSVLEQDFAEKEVIVVDDGSTDRTPQVLSRFRAQIRLLTQENRGLGASRNAAIRMATGEYFSFLDHDDRWAPGKLSIQMKAMLASCDDPLIFSHVEQFICPTMGEAEIEKLGLFQKILPGHIAGTLLISRARFEEIGPFLEERKQLGEFVEWYLRAFEKKIPMHMLPLVTLFRRIHQENMGRRDASRRGDYLKILKASLDRRRLAIQ